MNCGRLLSILALLVVATFGVAAQTLETVAPATATVGRAFNVEYRIALSGGRIRTPDFQGFILVGNGLSVVNDNTAYTFALLPEKEGVFTIPGATVVVDGREYNSKPVPIEVLGEAVVPTSNTARATGEDLFMRAIPDRTTVWKGEPVRVVFKLYSRYPNLRSESAKPPALNGFWSEALDVSHYSPQTENYNSAVYYTYITGEYLLFPLQSGTLTIDPMQFGLVIRQVSDSREMSLEELMLGVPNVVETSRTVSSPVVKINVKDLPAGAPEGFTGAVGNFNIAADPPQNEIMANASATYKITIAGTGNFRQIVDPQIEVPASFEMLNTKSIDETRPSSRGMTGSKQFEYPLVARAEGSYRIAPVEFSYFDPQKAKYQTVTTPEVRLDVLADTLSAPSSGTAMVGGITQRELEILNRDIRFIKHDAPELRKRGRVFVLSAGYFVGIVLLVAVFVGLFIYLRRFLERRRDADAMRGRRANKVVHARLRAAGEHLKDGNDRRFHDEMLKALWGYMGDKLNMPAANLTKENIRERLLSKKVNNDLIVRYINIISECESAQYSPGESAPSAEIYRAAAEVISNIERYFK